MMRRQSRKIIRRKIRKTMNVMKYKKKYINRKTRK